MGSVFDRDAFLADLAACDREADVRAAAQEVLRRALAEREAMAGALAPSVGGIRLLHHTPTLTVIDVAWAPRMRVMPHDHRMWALIAIYAGVEDNQFYRRGEDGDLRTTARRRVEAGEVCALGRETIHAVANPAGRLTGAIHVYGGDFVRQPRSQWGPGDLTERPYDMAEVQRQFHDANVAAGLLEA